MTNRLTNKAAKVLLCVLVGGCGSVTATGGDDAALEHAAAGSSGADAAAGSSGAAGAAAGAAGKDAGPELAACTPTPDWRFRLCGTYDDLTTVPAGRCIVCFTMNTPSGGAPPLATSCAPAAGATCVDNCDHCAP